MSGEQETHLHALLGAIHGQQQQGRTTIWTNAVRHCRAAAALALRWTHQDAHHMTVVYGPICALLYLLVWRYPELVVRAAPWCAAYCAAGSAWALGAIAWKRRQTRAPRARAVKEGPTP